MTLKPRCLAFAGGLLWGLCMLVTTLISANTGYATEFLEVMASIYPGYSISLSGSIIGMLYGFIDGFAGLYVLAWLYNRLEREK